MSVSIIVEQEIIIEKLKKEVNFLRICLSSFQKDDRDKLFEKLDLIRRDRDDCLFRYCKISEDINLLCSDIILINNSVFNNSATLHSDVQTAMQDVKDIDMRIKTNCY